ncbi:MAG: hypothetical protein PF517_22230 [Salinivirgaceae bacterium]|jgi:hypothetical protein|nr:hypothetical protein [Salinivirgaceae bacterium]
MVYFIAFIVFILNVPFGFWRGSLRKLSIAWFSAIHIPVILSIGLRYASGIETKALTIFLFVSVFFLGQMAGKYCYSFYILKKTDTK